MINSPSFASMMTFGWKAIQFGESYIMLRTSDCDDLIRSLKLGEHSKHTHYYNVNTASIEGYRARSCIPELLHQMQLVQLERKQITLHE